MKQVSQHGWYVLYSVFFLIVSIVLFRSLFTVNRITPTSISFFDFSLVVLASFRLTRLFVYDKITFFLRDALQHSEENYSQEGVTYTKKVVRQSGPLLTAHELLTCPWCFSIWVSLFVTYAYFLNTELFWLPIFVLAVSGTASFMQILANMIGWTAENKKLEAHGKNIDRTGV